MTAILYLFVYSSWGLGLLSALLALSMKLQEHSAKMKAVNYSLESMGSKRNILDGLVSIRQPEVSPPSGIPESLQNLIDRSKGHPEVDEIEPSDQIVGVLFKAHGYPPDMDETEDDSDDEKEPAT